MKLYIRRDSSPGCEQFLVYDELGQRKYSVVEVRTPVSLKYNIVSSSGSGAVIAGIRRMPVPIASTYLMKSRRGSLTFAAIPTRDGISSKLYGKNWRITGDMLSKDFSVMDVDNSVVMSQYNRGTNLELMIPDSSNELDCLMLSVCAGLINTVDRLAVQAV